MVTVYVRLHAHKYNKEKVVGKNRVCQFKEIKMCQGDFDSGESHDSHLETEETQCSH